MPVPWAPATTLAGGSSALPCRRAGRSGRPRSRGCTEGAPHRARVGLGRLAPAAACRTDACDARCARCRPYRPRTIERADPALHRHGIEGRRAAAARRAPRTRSRAALSSGCSVRRRWRSTRSSAAATPESAASPSPAPRLSGSSSACARALSGLPRSALPRPSRPVPALAPRLSALSGLPRSALPRPSRPVPALAPRLLALSGLPRSALPRPSRPGRAPPPRPPALSGLPRSALPRPLRPFLTPAPALPESPHSSAPLPPRPPRASASAATAPPPPRPARQGASALPPPAPAPPPRAPLAAAATRGASGWCGARSAAPRAMAAASARASCVRRRATSSSSSRWRCRAPSTAPAQGRAGVSQHGCPAPDQGSNGRCYVRPGGCRAGRWVRLQTRHACSTSRRAQRVCPPLPGTSAGDG